MKKENLALVSSLSLEQKMDILESMIDKRELVISEPSQDKYYDSDVLNIYSKKEIIFIEISIKAPKITKTMSANDFVLYHAKCCICNEVQPKSQLTYDLNTACEVGGLICVDCVMANYSDVENFEDRFIFVESN
jgi:hypothetical protein